MAKNKGSAKEGILIGDAFLDRGFTRPKVVFSAFLLWDLSFLLYFIFKIFTLDMVISKWDSMYI